ncbi:MAG TPA: sporulation protein YpjB [Pseudogracilibacillus sp.]|nr:sporulation protein YpjB [Pseudogracilibacillus sp.]
MMKKRWLCMVFIFFIGILVFFIIDGNISYAAEEHNKERPSFLVSGFVPFLSLIILIGGSITLTLTYVSWRKYRANKLSDKTKKRNSNR